MFHHMKFVTVENQENTLLNEETKATLSTQVGSIIKHMAKDGTIDLEKLVSKVRSEFAPTDQIEVKSYNIIIDRLLSNNEIFKASEALDMMKEEGMKPDLYTYSSLVKYYCKTNNLQNALQIIDEMKSEGIQPSVVTYSMIIKCVLKWDTEEKAFSIIRQMKSEGIEPNAHVLSTVIGQLDADRALQVFEVMKTEGVIPNLVVYNVLINVLLNAKRENKPKSHIDSVLCLLEQMNQADIQPDSITLNMVLDFLELHPSQKLAAVVLGWLKNNVVKADIITYHIMIRYAITLKDDEKVWSFFDEMKSKGLPNSDTYNIILHYLLSTQQQSLAMQLLKTMAEDQLAPSLETCTTIMSHCYTAGDPQTGAMVFDMMKNNGLELDSVVYNVPISYYVNLKAKEQVLLLYNEMQSEKITPCMVTYTLLMKLYCLLHDEDNIVKLFQSVREKAKPDIYFYTTITSYYGKTNNLTQLSYIARMIKEDRVEKNKIIRNILYKARYGKNKPIKVHPTKPRAK